MQWMRLHPLKAVFFTMIFTCLATSAAFREDLLIQIISVWFGVLSIWGFVVLRDLTKIPSGIGLKLMALMLAGLFSYSSGQAADPQPPPPRQDGAGIAIGAVVICVGGYCIYKMVKVCQKLFPKEKSANTNETPGLTFGVNGGGDEYGASWNYSPIGSCSDEIDGDTLTTGTHGVSTNESYVATLNIAVGEWGDVTTSIAAGKDTDGSQSQGWEEFQQEVASHGLVVSGIGDGSKFYSRNRVPCSSEAVPIMFDEVTRAIIHTGGSSYRMRTIIVERSRDFREWTHFMTVNQTFDSGFQVQDLTRYGQMFYRIRVQ